eukprot:scaffold9141_cov70-Phaeocystis_antarctica.AAC.6
MRTNTLSHVVYLRLTRSCGILKSGPVDTLMRASTATAMARCDATAASSAYTICVRAMHICMPRLVVSREAAATLVGELHHAHHVAQQRGAAAALMSRQAVRRLDGDAEAPPPLGNGRADRRLYFSAAGGSELARGGGASLGRVGHVFQPAGQTARALAAALVVTLLEATVGVGVGELDRQAALRATASDAFAELHLERRAGLPLGPLEEQLLAVL